MCFEKADVPAPRDVPGRCDHYTRPRFDAKRIARPQCHLP